MHVLLPSATRHYHCNPWSVKYDPGLLPALLKKLLLNNYLLTQEDYWLELEDSFSL